MGVVKGSGGGFLIFLISILDIGLRSLIAKIRKNWMSFSVENFKY